MMADEARQHFLEGVRLFNSGEYFEAHDVWEDAWRDASGVEREFYQGLIQAAVAMEHYRRSNPRGVISLARRFPVHLARVPGRFMGLDVGEFVRRMREVLRPVVEANLPAKRGEIVLDADRAPRIEVEGEGEC